MEFYGELWYILYFGFIILLGTIIYKWKISRSIRKQKMLLRGKVVWITGACSDIGKALSHVFYKQGCKVVLTSKNKFQLERIKEDLIAKRHAYCLEPLILGLDSRNIDSLLCKVYVACGCIDILIHSRKISSHSSVSQPEMDVYKEAMDFNQSIDLTMSVLPKMGQRQSGHIVSIYSVEGLLNLPEYSAYAAPKHTLQVFDSLSVKVNEHTVNISVINHTYIKPGEPVNPPITAEYKSTGRSPNVFPHYVASKILKTILKTECELIISKFPGHLGIFLQHKIPSLYHYVAARLADTISN